MIIPFKVNDFSPTLYIECKDDTDIYAIENYIKMINEAMVALGEVRRLFGSNWVEELIRFEDLARDL